MKCPKCNSDLTSVVRHKLNMNYCPSCKGMWLEQQELGELEDEAFDIGDDAKGTLAFSTTPTSTKCPECNSPLQKFNYRFYDLEMELCPNQHGYWLDEDEDNRVLELMKQEEKDVKRKVLAEDQWNRTLNRLRSGSFLSKLRNLFR
ncbi:MAG: zf-TFIIB domain-containing protein [Gammaproteobacteria bacterium]|nr:zf-TFIIB domain-containing protein [Gammaproteobacteria bacterium]